MTHELLLDVRSPAEYARGHIPGAVNVPLLDDGERHRVGLTYKEQGTYVAAELGVEIFAAKAEKFLAEVCRVIGEMPGRRFAAGHDEVDSDATAQQTRHAQARSAVRASPALSTALAIYCWRGGLRSGFVSRYLRAAGIPTRTFPGGYKQYRTGVLALLDELATKRFLVIDGLTGSGKTALLHRLAAHVPTIDFEALAAHRGSAFGDFAQTRTPTTQQNFENNLALAYTTHRTAPIIVVEIETVLGVVSLPSRLRTNILNAPSIVISRAIEERVTRLAAEYAAGWLPEQDTLFDERLKLLEQHITRDDRIAIRAAVAARDFATAVRLLLEKRYDKSYDKGLARRASQVLARFDLSTQGEDAALTAIIDLARAP